MNIIRLMRSKHILLLFLIFFILATLSSFLWLISDSLKRNFNFTASEVLGADGSIESNQALPKELYVLTKSYPVKLSDTVNFTSMAIADNHSVLAHIRAIENTYPLKGEVKIQAADHILTHAKLAPNQIWIDEALKTRLGVKLWDSIQLGQHHFQVAGMIISEPARAGMAFMLAPKIMIRVEDLDKTGLIQPYSRVLYQLFIQAEDQVFTKFSQQVKNQFSHLKVYSVQEGRPFANAIFNLAERYIGIFIILTVMLSGLGMIILSKAYATEIILMIALLRTFGISTKEIGRHYFFGFIFFGLGAIVISLGLAVGGVAWLNHFYPDYIEFKPHYLISLAFGKIALMQMMSFLLILFGFAFIPIMQTLKISPLYLFRKEVAHQSAWPIYVSAIGVILILLLVYVQNYTDVLMLFSYILLASVVLTFFFYSVLGLIKLAPMNLKSMLINARKDQNSLLITQFSILFLLSGLLWTIFNDFFGNWLASIPKNAPNQFMINITDSNKNNIEQFWKNNDIKLNLSPMLTARLKAVNNQPRAFHRTLNISYMAALPEDNKIIQGADWNANFSGESVISIEQNFANNIQAKLGDVILFDIGGQEIRGKIINIRNLKWETFKPNFYVIFPEKVLENFPKTYISSIYLPPNQLDKTTEFLKQFPAISLIDVKLSLEQVTLVLSKVVTALKYVMMVLFILVCLVYFAMVSVGFLERQYESALLRSIGATQGQLRNLILVEFGLIGGLSGGFGAAGAIILAILLSRQLSVTYHPNWIFVLTGAGLAALLTMIIGWLTTYKVVNTSPLVLLKEEG